MIDFHVILFATDQNIQGVVHVHYNYMYVSLYCIISIDVHYNYMYVSLYCIISTDVASLWSMNCANINLYVSQ